MLIKELKGEVTREFGIWKLKKISIGQNWAGVLQADGAEYVNISRAVDVRSAFLEG